MQHCQGCPPRQVQTCLFYRPACRRRCATWLTARTPQHANLEITHAYLGITHAWRDARTPYTEHVLTDSRAQNCRTDETRAVVDLWRLGQAGVGADSRFISVIRWTRFNTGSVWTSGGNSSAGSWRRVVCSRIVEDVWTVCLFGRPEGSLIDGGHVSRTASGRRIAWSACVERRLV